MSSFQENLKRSCDSVIDSVRTSSLNFSCQETPFSFYITLRKSFRKASHGQQLPRFPPQQAHQAEQLAQANYLRNAYNRIKYDLEDALMENESKNEVIASLETKLENSYEKAVRDSEKIEALSKELEGKEVVENKLVKETNESKSVIACLEHFLETCDEKAANDFKKIKSLTKDLQCALLAKKVAEDKLDDKKEDIEKESTQVLSVKESKRNVSFPDDEDLNYNDLNSNLVPMDIKSPESSSNSQTVDLKPSLEESSYTFEPLPSLSPARASTPPSSAPGTPTPLNFDQLSRSFRNFLEDFRDEKKQPKFINQAKEIIAYRGNVMHVSMLDLDHHNPFLCEQIKTSYYSMLFSLTHAVNLFVAENVDASHRTEFYLSFTDFTFESQNHEPGAKPDD